MNRLWRSLVLSKLRRWQTGSLTIVDTDQRFTFGAPESEQAATIRVLDPAFYGRVISGGALGAAESYLDGEWSSDDLAALIRLFIRNPEVSVGLDFGWAWPSQVVARLGQWWRHNTRTNARKHIHAHYDLGNEFFRLFLDDTLSYSSGFFEHPRASMQDASLAKMRQVCRKLQLQADDEVLEIGTGWGSLAVHVARDFGCRVKTTTISQEQAKLANERVRKSGLDHRVAVELEDYRDLRGEFDKLVSIEMIEAVGQSYLDTYFRQCSRLLRPHGLMLLQAIVIKDQVLRRYASSVDFINKYIFPGGFLPSISVISDSVARVTDMRMYALEEMSQHYVKTLQAWRAKFWQNISEVRLLGFDERFVRMWDYYLQYCIAAFEERQVNVVQILLAKPEFGLREHEEKRWDGAHCATVPFAHREGTLEWLERLR
jgi:cyclopropane-fatty-acyl-phospholipid synthase